MLRFLLHISLPVIVPLLVIGILIRPQLENNFDFTYYKHLGRHKSLIIGCSLSHFGIDPSAFSSRHDLFNYAFTNTTSPYSEAYYEAIQQKITKEKDAIFILEINPLLFIDKGEVDGISEKGDPQMDAMFFKNWDPNYEYVFRNSSPLYKIFTSSDTGAYVNYRNGFTALIHRIEKKERLHKKRRLYPLAADRMEYFQKTIDLLRQYGRVFFVSVPIDASDRKLEDEMWPGFYDSIKVLAQQQNISYIDLQPDFPDLKMADNSHLGAKDAELVSKVLSDKVEILLKQQR
ncbi:MAG: hypothetical protein ACKOXB_06190 [Flavobacteriales bacterium]